MPTKYNALIPYHTQRPSEHLTIYYAVVPKALDQHAVAGPMRGLGLKEMARWTLYYVPHTMG